MKKIYSLLFLSVFSLSTAMAQSTWNTTGIGGGGALFSPTINPANTSEFYVACDMSDLFHTTDFGLNYTIVDFRQLQSSHNSSVRFTNTNLRYCINYANNEIVPVKSTDGGATWTKLSGNPDASQETFSIWADYNNPQHVIISYYADIYFSSNGGTSFTNIHTAINSGSGAEVGGVFFEGNNIYIGTNDGIIESSNGGTSFTTLTATGIPSTDRLFSFAAAKQGTTTRFFCVTSASANVYPGVVGSDYSGFLTGVYSMDNNSGTWTSRMTGLSTSTDDLMFVAMAENDITTAYIGGSAGGIPNVVKTTDGGLTWNHIFNTASNQNIVTGWCGTGGDHNYGWPECLFGMTVAASDKNVIVLSDYSNPTKSNDGGVTWKQAYVNPADQHAAGANTPTKKYYHSIGMENTAAWYLQWSDASNVFAGYTDIFAIRSKDAGASWAFDYTGPTTNTMYCITKNISSSTLYAATSSIHDMYKSYRLADGIIDASTVSGKVIYSTDMGATWTQLHDFGKPVYWLATDPNNSNRMYAAVVNHTQGVGGIWVTNNLSAGAASNWTQLSQPPRTEGHPATMTVLNNGNLLCSFSGRRAPSAFTQSSGIFVYNTTNSTWADKSDAGQKYWCHDVVVDPNDGTQNTWYSCVYSGFGGTGNGLGGLYKTKDGGTTWTRILSNNDVSSCTFNPNNSNELFITTHGNGLWHSGNINAATPTFNQVSNYIFSVPERVFFNPFDKAKIWVTSFGNGLQWADMGATGINNFTQGLNTLRIYPNPASGSITIETGENAVVKSITIFNMLGEKVEINSEINSNSIRLDAGALPAGVYFVKVELNNKVLTGKFVKE